MRNGDEFGITCEFKVNFAKVMERMRKVRAEISHHDSAEGFGITYNVEVMKGNARFVSENSMEVDGKIVRFKRACICTGGTPYVPDVPGLRDSPY
jgi:pyruvate/2-oxoglutarate dehydrogenase complex dihydrolipoamide dehydrogenase (E3) component